MRPLPRGNADVPWMRRSISSDSTSAEPRASSTRCRSRPLRFLPGAAAGAGLSLALACDLRIASDNAILTTAFANVGFAGDYGGTFFMSQLIGGAKTRELYFLCDKIDAATALRLGLVNQVVPAAELEEASMALARRLAAGPSIAYRYMKENINRALAGGEMGDCLDLEATHHVHTSFTKDHRNRRKGVRREAEARVQGRVGFTRHGSCIAERNVPFPVRVGFRGRSPVRRALSPCTSSRRSRAEDQKPGTGAASANTLSPAVM